MALNADRWTVIATKPNNSNAPRIAWRYEPDFNAATVSAAASKNQWVIAHRRVPDGWHLVAKLPQPQGEKR